MIARSKISRKWVVLIIATLTLAVLLTCCSPSPYPVPNPIQVRIMGKSLDYIKHRVINQKNTNLDIIFDDAFEISPKKFIELDGNNQLSLNYKNNDTNMSCDISVKVTYDPDVDFKYFTTSSSRHDGTMLFVHENIKNCLNKILFLQTYDKNVGMPNDANNCNYFYTIGDIVVVNEYGMQFATDEKPWMQQRTTVMIPIVFSYEEK